VLFGYFDLGAAGANGGVAYFAHIGGFAFGLIAIKLFADDRKRRGQIDRVRF
jgi:membrane associated rhomboid family serine protease